MKKTQVLKKNVYEWYENNKFENAIKYAKTNSHIEGVDDYLSKLQEQYKNYIKEMDNLIKNENSLLDNRFYTWSTVDKISIICKWGNISFFALSIIGNIVRITYSLNTLIFLGAVFGCIAFIFLKIASFILSYQYNSKFKIVENKAKAINNKYLTIIPTLWNKIDDLYLDSLEPTHRETVLMRRDQERQHQELIQIQKQHQKKQEEIMRIQEQQQLEMIKEQKRTRKAQEEILGIENRTRKAQEEMLEIEREREREKERRAR